ncbi:MAG: hypothetical protein RSD35_02585, partial [Oscillospiraceae bacterium]
MFSKPFHFSENEAKIVAKWEIGVRNFVQPLTVLLFVMIGAIEVIRYIVKIPIAPVAYYIADLAAIFIFMIMLGYIGKRINSTALKIQKREIAVDFNFDESYISVVEYGDKIIFKSSYNDIFHIDAGENVVRINSITGVICLP